MEKYQLQIEKWCKQIEKAIEKDDWDSAVGIVGAMAPWLYVRARAYKRFSKKVMLEDSTLWWKEMMKETLKKRMEEAQK